MAEFIAKTGVVFSGIKLCDSIARSSRYYIRIYASAGPRGVGFYYVVFLRILRKRRMGGEQDDNKNKLPHGHYE
jgi:hypothetical protein